MRELWAINVGTYAAQRKLVLYRGTKLGALRRARRAWRTSALGESVTVGRPGCSWVAYGDHGTKARAWHKPVTGTIMFYESERIAH
jgi:hypothetical protein